MECVAKCAMVGPDLTHANFVLYLTLDVTDVKSSGPTVFSQARIFRGSQLRGVLRNLPTVFLLDTLKSVNIDVRPKSFRSYRIYFHAQIKACHGLTLYKIFKAKGPCGVNMEHAANWFTSPKQR